MGSTRGIVEFITALPRWKNRNVFQRFDSKFCFRIPSLAVFRHQAYAYLLTGCLLNMGHFVVYIVSGFVFSTVKPPSVIFVAVPPFSIFHFLHLL